MRYFDLKLTESLPPPTLCVRTMLTFIAKLHVIHIVFLCEVNKLFLADTDRRSQTARTVVCVNDDKYRRSCTQVISANIGKLPFRFTIIRTDGEGSEINRFLQSVVIYRQLKKNYPPFCCCCLAFSCN